MKTLRGTSIIEIVIATALISMAIIAALSLTNSSQKQNTYARGLAEATKYTTQAADWLRSERNLLGYATIESKSNKDYCLNNLPPSYTDLIEGECDEAEFIPGTRYQRRISLVNLEDPSDPALNGVRATIVVTWVENIPRQATIEMELTQW